MIDAVLDVATTTCAHPDADAYMLGVEGAWVRFCRNTDCHAWRLTHPDRPSPLTGSGLASYQAAVEALAVESGWSDGLRFLFDLGGHAQEVAWNSPSPLEPALRALDDALAQTRSGACPQSLLERMHREVLARRVTAQVGRITHAAEHADRHELARLFAQLERIPAPAPSRLTADDDIPF